MSPRGDESYDNPYASFGAPPPPEEPPGGYAEGPARVSVMAASSLLLALPCSCIPLLAVVTGPLAILLGALSLKAIGRSRGMLVGKPMALAGVILGLILTALQVYLLYGALQFGVFYTKTMLPVAQQFMTAAAAGDAGAARPLLGPSAMRAVEDERLIAFGAAMYAELGGVRAVEPQNFSALGESFELLGRAGPDAPRLELGQAIIVNVRGGSTDAQVWVIFDRTSLQQEQAHIDDILIVLPGDRALTLREAGVGADLARAVGLEIVEIPAAP